MTTVETAIGTAKTMVLNMGPQHPSTHGVLRVLLELDGENVVTAVPDLDANANAVAIEHLKIELEGWERDLATVEPNEAAAVPAAP